MSKDDNIISITGVDEEDYQDHTILGGQSEYDYDYEVDDNITIDTSCYDQYAGSLGNITLSSTANHYGPAIASNSSSASVNWSSTVSAGLSVEGDADFSGDLKWQGRSLGALLEKIESRLAILHPDLEKLEHFEALKKAYDNYKMLEALCEIPVVEDDE